MAYVDLNRVAPVTYTDVRARECAPGAFWNQCVASALKLFSTVSRRTPHIEENDVGMSPSFVHFACAHRIRQWCYSAPTMLVRPGSSGRQKTMAYISVSFLKITRSQCGRRIDWVASSRESRFIVLFPSFTCMSMDMPQRCKPGIYRRRIATPNSSHGCNARHCPPGVTAHCRGRRASGWYTRHARGGVRRGPWERPYLSRGTRTRGFEDGPVFRRA